MSVRFQFDVPILTTKLKVSAAPKVNANLTALVPEPVGSVGFVMITDVLARPDDIVQLAGTVPLVRTMFAPVVPPVNVPKAGFGRIEYAFVAIPSATLPSLASNAGMKVAKNVARA
jgi:hypothetical protein